MAEQIQVKYEELDQLTSQIHTRAEQISAVFKKIQSQTATLATSWRGQGVDQFQQEMEDLVLPSLKRLSNSLKETGESLGRIKEVFLEAEEEAVKCFPDSEQSAHSNFLEWVHGILDIAGFIPGVGEIADGTNAIIYLGEGRYLEAGISAGAMLPILGDLGKVGKWGARASREILEEGLERSARELGEETLERSARESMGSGATARTVPHRGQVRPPLPRGANAPRANLNRFNEPFHVNQGMSKQDEILELARTDPQAAGRQYERLVASDIQGGLQVENRFGRQGRRMDIGTEHEVTIEGMNGGFSSNKLDQLWDDLMDKRNVTLTVPRLSRQAEDQLQRMLAQARTEIDPNVIIVVRETLPR